MKSMSLAFTGNMSKYRDRNIFKHCQRFSCLLGFNLALLNTLARHAEWGSSLYNMSEILQKMKLTEFAKAKAKASLCRNVCDKGDFHTSQGRCVCSLMMKINQIKVTNLAACSPEVLNALICLFECPMESSRKNVR